VLVTVTVPSDIKKLSVNLKAPIVINVDELKAEQLIIDDSFPVKYMIYDILQNKKSKWQVNRMLALTRKKWRIYYY